MKVLYRDKNIVVMGVADSADSLEIVCVPDPVELKGMVEAAAKGLGNFKQLEALVKSQVRLLQAQQAVIADLEKRILALGA